MIITGKNVCDVNKWSTESLFLNRIMVKYTGFFLCVYEYETASCFYDIPSSVLQIKMNFHIKYRPQQLKQQYVQNKSGSIAKSL